MGGWVQRWIEVEVEVEVERRRWRCICRGRRWREM
jgi:hypothetical protein